ncbi:hypothetical protein [Dongia deserti]|uniref:hypothetical protein n=1 Tax=Dongia deserti TaxID=2268030 RepID=UPI000E64F1D9|nr:hypothetical protein [Dongia deserti]
MTERQLIRKQWGAWAILIVALSPAILSIIFGLVAMLLPREPWWDTCSAFLSHEIMITTSRIAPALGRIALPCSVLAVQLSVVVPFIALGIFILMARKQARRRAAIELNAFIFLFFVALAYVLWMDVFFVGVTYAVAPARRSPLLMWLIGTSLVSLVSVYSLLGVVLIVCRKIRALLIERPG